MYTLLNGVRRQWHFMRTSWYGIDFLITEPLWGESTVRQWIHPKRSSNTISLDKQSHYSDVIIGAMASQITSLTIVYSTVDSGADQRKHRSSASLAFVLGIRRWPVNSPPKWPVTRKMFPVDGFELQYMHRMPKWKKFKTWCSTLRRLFIPKKVYFPSKSIMR